MWCSTNLSSRGSFRKNSSPLSWNSMTSSILSTYASMEPWNSGGQSLSEDPHPHLNQTSYPRHWQHLNQVAFRVFSFTLLYFETHFMLNFILLSKQVWESQHNFRLVILIRFYAQRPVSGGSPPLSQASQPLRVSY